MSLDRDEDASYAYWLDQAADDMLAEADVVSDVFAGLPLSSGKTLRDCFDDDDELRLGLHADELLTVIVSGDRQQMVTAAWQLRDLIRNALLADAPQPPTYSDPRGLAERARVLAAMGAMDYREEQAA
jgi:hypothetical protein